MTRPAIIRGDGDPRDDLAIDRPRIRVDCELWPEANRCRMFDARMAVHFVGQGIDIPGLSIGLSIMLAAKVEDFVLESLIAVPAVTREDTVVL